MRRCVRTLRATGRLLSVCSGPVQHHSQPSAETSVDWGLVLGSTPGWQQRVWLPLLAHRPGLGSLRQRRKRTEPPAHLRSAMQNTLAQRSATVVRPIANRTMQHAGPLSAVNIKSSDKHAS